jgi:O-6-methylguanine DNA methyltransferase
VTNPSRQSVRARICRLAPGSVTVHWHGKKVTRVEFASRAATAAAAIRRYDERLAEALLDVLDGGRIPAWLRVDAGMLGPFERQVLGRCAGIMAGEVMTYGELARAVGRPDAARRVGQVLAGNPFALLIPCHRVVGTGGRLTGFAGGIYWKEFLLTREGWRIAGKGRTRRLAGRW